MDSGIGNWFRSTGARSRADAFLATYAHIDPGAADSQIAAPQHPNVGVRGSVGPPSHMQVLSCGLPWGRGC